MKIKILSFLAIIFIVSAFAPAGMKVIDSKEAKRMLQSKVKYVVLDVRTPAEFKSGHIKGAINIDINQDNAFTKIDKLDHKAKYIVHCRTKNRSQIAVEYMISKGFKEIYKMNDGITGWIANGFPVQ